MLKQHIVTVIVETWATLNRPMQYVLMIPTQMADMYESRPEAEASLQTIGGLCGNGHLD